MKKEFLSVAGVLVLSLVLSSMTTSPPYEQDPWAVPLEYQEMKNPYAHIQDEEKIGRILYSKNCRTCHGNKGKGDGTAAKLLETKVADFTSDTFKNQTDGTVYYKMSTGRNAMPGFKRVIPEDEDLWLLVNYIKTL